MITSIFFYYFYYYFFFFFFDFNSGSIFYFLFEIFNYFWSSSSFVLQSIDPTILVDFLMSLPPKATINNIINKTTPMVVSFSNSTQKIDIDISILDNISYLFNKILFSYSTFYNYIEIWNYLMLNPFMLFYSLVFIRTLIFSIIFLNPFYLYIFNSVRYSITFKSLDSHKLFSTPVFKDEFFFNILPTKFYYNFYIDYSFSHVMKFKRKVLKHLSMLKNDHSFSWGFSDLYLNDFFCSLNFYHFIH